MGRTYLAEPNADEDGARTLRPLQAAAVTYRIAFGPRAGQRMLALRGTMPREATARPPSRARRRRFEALTSYRCGRTQLAPSRRRAAQRRLCEPGRAPSIKP
jgi:hypothetical protein